jgi:hypothetical protein
MSTNPAPSKSASWSVRCYRQLIRIYPKEFTATFGDSVDQAFRDLARDAFRDRGRLGLVLLWCRIVPDFIFSAIELFTAKAGDYLKWSFRLRWFVACSAGFALGLTLSNLLGWSNFPRGLGGIPLWLILGFLQSFVLTEKYCSRARWVLFSAVGAALAFVLTKTVFDPLAVAHVLPQWAMLILNFPAVINGAIIGLFQRQAFRKGQPKTWRWVLACSMGLYFFWLVMIVDSLPTMSLIQRAGMAIGFDYNFNIFILANFINCLGAGVVFGGFTVGPLERILRLRPASAVAPAQKLTSE